MTVDYDKFLTDEEMIKLAITACESWNENPHRTIFNAPTYHHWIRAAINETNHEMGRRLMDTPEYRQVLIDQLILLSKDA
jgi:hypothetical protein